MVRYALVLVAAATVFAACGERSSIASDGSQSDAPQVDGAASDHRPPDQPCTCRLTITRINGKLASAVTAVAGGSITVEVTTTCLPDGAKIALMVTGLAMKPVALVVNDKAVFNGVAISPLVSTVILAATAPGCAPGTHSFNVIPPPECVFISPKDGAFITPGSLKVKLGFVNAIGGYVSLRANGAAVGPPVAISAFGALPPLKVSPGTLLLEALVVVPTGSTPLKSTCTATVVVSSPP